VDKPANAPTTTEKPATADPPITADKSKTPEAMIDTSPMGLNEPKVDPPSVPSPPPPPKEEEVPIVKIQPKPVGQSPLGATASAAPSSLQVAPVTPPKKERSPASVALIVILIILLTALINDVVIYYFFFLKK
jgi:hypothetical protein